MLQPQSAQLLITAFGLLALRRGWQGLEVLRYRRNLRRLPRYQLRSTQIPVSKHRLFLGKGFRWQAIHTQRLHDCLRPEVQHYLSRGLIPRKKPC
ncbi:hypothetical protein J2125_003917 [Erwinia toletana]|uniref:Uncharacterized protein n=1 Tax=Winslowiella toletana TaxID=92490 RepID=A0ABS4PF28_9GAMM|nr:hypothetical protein [Winslowiella toletana]